MNDSELVMNINNKISNLLEDRNFDFEYFKTIIDNICIDINKLLLDKNNIPCSYHTG
jgi:hypothetical protein